MVRNAPLREIVRPNSLNRSPLPTCVLRSAARSASSLTFVVVETRPQYLHGLRAILVLRLFVLTLHNYTRRQMSDTDRTVGLVDMLPPAPEAR